MKPELFYAEKICDQEKELRRYRDETRRKDKVISELDSQLEAAKINNSNKTQMEEISRPVFNTHLFGWFSNMVYSFNWKCSYQCIVLTTLTFRKLYQQRMWSYRTWFQKNRFIFQIIFQLDITALCYWFLNFGWNTSWSGIAFWSWKFGHNIKEDSRHY